APATSKMSAMSGFMLWSTDETLLVDDALGGSSCVLLSCSRLSSSCCSSLAFGAAVSWAPTTRGRHMASVQNTALTTTPHVDLSIRASHAFCDVQGFGPARLSTTRRHRA